jgi:hypothetical protein
MHGPHRARRQCAHGQQKIKADRSGLVRDDRDRTVCKALLRTPRYSGAYPSLSSARINWAMLCDLRFWSPSNPIAAARQRG